MAELHPDLSRQVEQILGKSDNEIATMCEELVTYIIDNDTATHEADSFLHRVGNPTVYAIDQILRCTVPKKNQPLGGQVDESFFDFM